MQTNEFRVRPVTRFILTHYRENPEERSSGSRQIGEFLSVDAAEEVGVALQALVPGSTLETIEGRQAAYPPKALAAAMAVRQEPEEMLWHYAVVERTFTTETRCWYAETREEAEACKASCEKEFGTEFRIFRQPVTDPVKYAQRGMTAPSFTKF